MLSATSCSGESIRIGDSVALLAACADDDAGSTADAFFYARVVDIFKDPSGATIVRGAWYEDPAETCYAGAPGNEQNELYCTDHVGDNDVATVHFKIEVLNDLRSYRDAVAAATNSRRVFLVRRYWDAEMKILINLRDPEAEQWWAASLGAQGQATHVEGKTAAPASEKLEPFDSSDSDAGIPAVSLLRAASQALSLSNVPPQLPCRDEERAQLSGHIEECLRRRVGTALYVCGLPGIGKTALLSEIVRGLLRRSAVLTDGAASSSASRRLPRFRVTSINAMKLARPDDIYSVLAAQLLMPRSARAEAAASHSGAAADGRGASLVDWEAPAQAMEGAMMYGHARAFRLLDGLFAGRAVEAARDGEADSGRGIHLARDCDLESEGDDAADAGRVSSRRWAGASYDAVNMLAEDEADVMLVDAVGGNLDSSAAASAVSGRKRAHRKRAVSDRPDALSPPFETRDVDVEMLASPPAAVATMEEAAVADAPDGGSASTAPVEEMCCTSLNEAVAADQVDHAAVTLPPPLQWAGRSTRRAASAALHPGAAAAAVSIVSFGAAEAAAAGVSPLWFSAAGIRALADAAASGAGGSDDDAALSAALTLQQLEGAYSQLVGIRSWAHAPNQYLEQQLWIAAKESALRIRMPRHLINSRRIKEVTIVTGAVSGVKYVASSSAAPIDSVPSLLQPARRSKAASFAPGASREPRASLAASHSHGHGAGDGDGGSDDRPMELVLIDEADSLAQVAPGQDHPNPILYNLFNWPQWPASRLAVVCVGNTIGLPELLPPKVRSRMAAGRMQFAPYTAAQLAEIARVRLAGAGLRPEAATPAAAASAAASAASAGAALPFESGDAEAARGAGTGSGPLHEVDVDGTARVAVATPAAAIVPVPDSSPPVPAVFENNALQTAARLMAGASGDVRLTMTLLQGAIRGAAERLKRQAPLGAAAAPAFLVSIDDVRAAVKATRDPPSLTVLRGCSTWQRLLLVSAAVVQQATGSLLLTLEEVHDRMQAMLTANGLAAMAPPAYICQDPVDAAVCSAEANEVDCTAAAASASERAEAEHRRACVGPRRFPVLPPRLQQQQHAAGSGWPGEAEGDDDDLRAILSTLPAAGFCDLRGKAASAAVSAAAAAVATAAALAGSVGSSSSASSSSSSSAGGVGRGGEGGTSAALPFSAAAQMYAYPSLPTVDQLAAVAEGLRGAGLMELLPARAHRHPLLKLLVAYGDVALAFSRDDPLGARVLA